MKKIGFIGVGVMGKSMVRNLMKNGYELTIYSRTKEKCLDVIEEGAVWCDDIRSCVAGQDVIITMVGYPKDVEEVYFGEGGVIANARKGAYLIDMTTTSPKLSVRIYNEAKRKSVFALDAPVSGGDTGAKNGTLSIMVGGDKEAFDACHQVFETMGTNIVYEGGPGCGQHTKMANQIALSGVVASVCEAIAYGRKVGLDVNTMLASISAGAAGSWQMTNTAPRMLKKDYAPGFFIKHYIKDMNIATEEAEDVGLELPILNEVLRLYERMDAEGLGNLGTQALIKEYEKDEIAASMSELL
ncbi:NAD(P)-dependent oxidoreductase [Phocea massiliensis]|uniref:2-hydroxy-3-oxopropionate reductase n=1 Tax=uncultured Anaerotruncus sp. TaxID=905011 RepID=A0A6N2UJW4_9FIRM|nr:NAD(P)-dependent oxidoreductase [Merdimmobilis hominis]MCD4835276.1 NAD(P)-dependent oxidoreductase [Merdimmobilis hominis]